MAPELNTDSNTERLLVNLLEDAQIEDFSISDQTGVHFYKKQEWHRVDHLDKSTLPIITKNLCHHISELAQVTLSARHPSLDTRVDNLVKNQSFRAHIVVPPMSSCGTQITLRRIKKNEADLSIENFDLHAPQLKNLKESLSLKKSILICGPTGSGKTSLLKALLKLCPPNERIAILEDTQEIIPPNSYSFHLQARTDKFQTLEGSTWQLENLVHECLRMRPDRIVLGECRGSEALGLLHAMQSGHQGVLCTLHASSLAQALERFENLVHLGTSHKKIKKETAVWDVVVVMDSNRSLKVHHLSS